MDNPFLKGVKKDPEDPKSTEDVAAPQGFSPEEMMDFWEGLATLLKQRMRDVKIIVWGDDNAFASIHLANVRSAIMEFKEGSSIPILCLNVGIPSNVAAKIALTVDKYCNFHLGQVFSHKDGDFVWGSEAIQKYFSDVYLTEKERLAQAALESEKKMPDGTIVH